MADVFVVTLDFLVGEQGMPNHLSQSELMERWSTLDSLPDDDKDRSLYVVDSLIREAKTRQAFGAA